MASSNGKSTIRESFQPDFKIFIKDLRDRQGRKRPLTIRSWSTIKDVKDQIQHMLHVPPSAQRLYFGPLLISGKELPNHRSLHDAGIYKSGETLLLDINNKAREGLEESPSSITNLRESGVNDMCISSSMFDSTPKAMRRIIQQARRGLMLGLKPILVLDGSGGTYFMHDARKVKVAVFKPADEEPYAENNPRGYVKQHDSVISLREGILPGEACLREVAAYLLDHEGFSSVPMTTLAEARHPAFSTNGLMLKLAEGGAAIGPHSLNSSFVNGTSSSSSPALIKKVGSCQEFIYAEDTMDDLSPSMLSTDEVHKIAILDIRIMNADRNVANLLVRRKPDNSFELVPIDHGYCLRSVCDVSWFDWCWLDWPQLKKPLSEKSKDYILNLNIDADVLMLQESLQIGTEALDFFRASNKILQAGVKAGLSLYDIATLCCRYDDAGEIHSKLEVLTNQAQDLAQCAIKNGRWGHATASQAIAEQISHSPTTVNEFAPSTSIAKSKSLANFSSFAFDFTAAEDSPNSAPTSGSESSEDRVNEEVPEDNEDDEDCQEWAAGIVADVNNIDSTLRPRTLSEVSLESLFSDASSVPYDNGASYGFWRVRPGDTEFSDDESWSPSPSPTLPPFTSPDMKVEELEEDVTDDDPSKPNVTFVGLAEKPKEVFGSSLSNSKLIDLTPKESRLSSFSSRSTGGLVRSHSYSAFSLRTLGDSTKPSKVPLVSRNTSADNENLRQYFHKFVDLLIERETVASARRKKLGMCGH